MRKRRRARDQLRAIFAKLKDRARNVFSTKAVESVTVPSIARKRLDRPGKSEESAISFYLKTATNVPLLTREQEVELGKQVRSGDSVKKHKAIDKLIKANTRLVVAIAKSYQHHGLPLEDLVQEGNIGLVAAANKFNPAKKTSFATHATYWIKQSIGRAIEKHGDTIRQSANILWNKHRVKKVEEDFFQRTGRLPDDDDLMYITGLSKSQLKAARELSRKTVSLDKPLSIDENITLEDVIPSKLQDYDAKKDIDTTSRLRIIIKKAKLTPTERVVILDRYGLGDDIPKSGSKVGKTLNMSRQRVNQIEQKALRKLRGGTDSVEEFLKKYHRKRQIHLLEVAHEQHL